MCIPIADASPRSEDERRALCRRTLERGDLLSAKRYARLLQSPLHDDAAMPYDVWVQQIVDEEVMTRDAVWMHNGIAPPILCEEGAEPLAKELACARILADNGFRIVFRRTRPTEMKRTSDILMGDSLEPWEMKQPTGCGRQTIFHQFEEAAGQASKLIIDTTAIAPGTRWYGDAIIAECQRLLTFEFKTGIGG